MNKLQQALVEATPEEIAEVLLPFSKYGVKTFPELLKVYSDLDSFKTSRLKVEESQRTEQQKLEERQQVVTELLEMGIPREQLGERATESPLVEAVLALPEGKRPDLIKMYLPTKLPGGVKKTVILGEVKDEEAKLGEEEAKELVSAFPNAVKK